MDKSYYNSHGHSMTFAQFIELEVHERGNYEMNDILDVMVKNGISNETLCIWVHENPKIAYAFGQDASMLGEVISGNEDIIPLESAILGTVRLLVPRHGYLIEIQDDIGGILMVLNEAGEAFLWECLSNVSRYDGPDRRGLFVHMDPDKIVGAYAKIPLTDNGEPVPVEHIWVAVLSYNKENKLFTGKLNNQPVILRDYVFGQIVSFSIEDIEEEYQDERFK